MWVLYPEQSGVRVFLPSGASFWKGIGDTLSMTELLPGWEFPVARLFEDYYPQRESRLGTNTLPLQQHTEPRP